jgi:hypothetical protein
LFGLEIGTGKEDEEEEGPGDFLEGEEGEGDQDGDFLEGA